MPFWIIIWHFCGHKYNLSLVKASKLQGSSWFFSIFYKTSWEDIWSVETLRSTVCLSRAFIKYHRSCHIWGRNHKMYFVKVKWLRFWWQNNMYWTSNLCLPSVSPPAWAFVGQGSNMRPRSSYSVSPPKVIVSRSHSGKVTSFIQGAFGNTTTIIAAGGAGE